MGVSEAKAHFLELIRKVEKGERFEITRGGKIVATIAPSGTLPAIGFATIEILGDIVEPIAAGWTSDQENLKPGKSNEDPTRYSHLDLHID